MTIITLTKQQARQFMLLKHGLIGERKFIGKDGVLAFVRQAGCIQFDPIDVCGKNAELVLQSRVKGFTKKMLYELLYEDRKLIDYFDKNLAIMAFEDWRRILNGSENPTGITDGAGKRLTGLPMRLRQSLQIRASMVEGYRV